MSTAVLTATWHERLAELLAVQAEAERHENQIYAPLHAAFSALFPAWPNLDPEARAAAQRWMEESRLNWACETSDAMGERCGDLIDGLILEPAPDRAAALWKFRYLYASEKGGAEWTEEFVAQANTDIERFLENN